MVVSKEHWVRNQECGFLCGFHLSLSLQLYINGATSLYFKLFIGKMQKRGKKRKKKKRKGKRNRKSKRKEKKRKERKRKGESRKRKNGSMQILSLAMRDN